MCRVTTILLLTSVAQAYAAQAYATELVARRLAQRAETVTGANVTLDQTVHSKKPRPDSHTCSADEQIAINAFPAGDNNGGFPKTVENCAHAGLNIFVGINALKFNACLTEKLSISNGCSTCFANAAEYGYENCKLSCLFSWCSTGCLKCAAGFDAKGCTGFDAPQPDPCDGQLVQHAQSPVISNPTILLVIVFAGSGVAFALLRVRRSALTFGQEVLLAD